MISNMKLTNEGRLQAFETEKANKCTYVAMREKSARLALQIYQQYFHLYKPQKYTHPDLHVAYAFSMASKKNRTFKGDWGMKILKEIKKAASSQSCAKNGYYGCGAVLTRIAYEAMGMTDLLQPMQEDMDILKDIKK